jgi:hypothetical protein
MTVKLDPEFLAAYETFANNMEFAFGVGAGSEPDQPLATEQTRYVGATLSVASFLKAVGFDEPAAKFYLLAEAMLDVSAGLRHPLFAVENPKASGGRPPDTTAVWRTRSTLCIGLRYLMAGGNLKEDEAIDFAIKRHRDQLAKLQRPGSELATSIGGWMKQFATDAVQNQIALSHYKQSMSGLAAAQSNNSGIEVKQAGERRIAVAADLAASLP